jgi:hypothetical protein
MYLLIKKEVCFKAKTCSDKKKKKKIENVSCIAIALSNNDVLILTHINFTSILSCISICFLLLRIYLLSPGHAAVFNFRAHASENQNKKKKEKDPLHIYFRVSEIIILLLNENSTLKMRYFCSFILPSMQ